jgi:4-oxalocrotonate tautomerase
MPLIQISLLEGKSQEYIKAIADGVHKALCATWKIPENDRFQIINEYKKDRFYMDKTIWVNRSDDVVIIYITSIMRTAEMKRNFYAELVKILEIDPKIKGEDIFVTIVNNDRENWSFGNGIAQLTSDIKP